MHTQGKKYREQAAKIDANKSYAPREAIALARATSYAKFNATMEVHMHLGVGNFKVQFRRADRSGACLAVILGDAELERGVVAVKPLRREAGQSECPLAELAPRVRRMLEEESWTST